MIDWRNLGLVSASTRGGEDEDLPAPDYPSKPETHPDSICETKQLSSMLVQAMKTLPERYQQVMLLYYSSEMTMREIRTELGVNESRVSQMHKVALAKMGRRLRVDGIDSSQAFSSR